jgi:hypothetical protein
MLKIFSRSNNNKQMTGMQLTLSMRKESISG